MPLWLIFFRRLIKSQLSCHEGNQSPSPLIPSPKSEYAQLMIPDGTLQKMVSVDASARPLSFEGKIVSSSSGGLPSSITNRTHHAPGAGSLDEPRKRPTALKPLLTSDLPKVVER